MADGLHISDGVISLSDGDRIFRLEIDRLDLMAGQAVALTGASGAGKTLLLEVLGLLRAPGGGTCYDWISDGASVNLAALWAQGPRSSDLAQNRGALFGFVPQSGGLVPFLSVAENISMPQRVTGRLDAAWACELLDRLGLSDVADMLPGTLSIGQRQRTSIARSLAHRPPFVIADEPTAALDPDSADRVLELLLDVAGARGSGVILSSHDVARIDRFGIKRLFLSTETTGTQVLSRLAVAPC